MVKYNIVVSDPPWNFQDKLKMSDVKRGAESQYSVLFDQDIKNLDVSSIVADDALLVLWVPGSKLQIGLDVMKAWGFEQKQVYCWVKHKKEPFKDLLKKIISNAYGLAKGSLLLEETSKEIEIFCLNDILAFGMGRLFRQTHEIALIGTKGKIYSRLKNKSQRSVLFDVNYKHSAKPEGLQDSLDLMFPDTDICKLEMFGRRLRDGWTVIGNECPGDSFGEDIIDSINRLKNL